MSDDGNGDRNPYRHPGGRTRSGMVAAALAVVIAVVAWLL